MSDNVGVTITIGDIYNLLLRVDTRVITIEGTIATLDTKEDSARIRKLQGQVAAMWVVHTIMLAAITANYIKGV